MSPQTVETALSDHVATWLRQYLGRAEARTPGIPSNSTVFPPDGPRGWRRREQWPPDDIAGECCIYFVSGEVTNLRQVRSQNLLWGTLEVVVTVCVGGQGAGTSFELGEIPRIYLGALLELFAQKAVFHDDLVIQTPSKAAPMTGETANGDAVGIAMVTTAIDFPVAELQSVFAAIPDVDDYSTPPDNPELADTLISTVEAVPNG